MDAPVYGCRAAGCGGSFAPSPFSAGCFPLTPKVSWDITQVSPAHPARWVDLRLLRLCDGIIFGGGRSASVYSLVAAIHRCLKLNGCGVELSFEHLKRQLGEAIMVRARRGGTGGGAGCGSALGCRGGHVLEEEGCG